MPKVKLFANLRKVAGTKELFIPGANASAVVFELVKQNPMLAGYLLENDPDNPAGSAHIHQHVIITINGQTTNDLGVAVTEQDQIAIFPPIAGG